MMTATRWICSLRVGPVYDSITQDMRSATLVIDLLGTGISGAARGIALEWIREINHGFPHAKVLAVDLPSGMDSDRGVSEGEVARADACVTFTGLKVCHALPPNCDACGEVTVGKIGSPDEYMADSLLHLTEPADFGRLLGPRKVDTNKGDYGHVLVVGGAEGKTGAAEMAGIAALRGRRRLNDRGLFRWSIPKPGVNDGSIAFFMGRPRAAHTSETGDCDRSGPGYGRLGCQSCARNGDERERAASDRRRWTECACGLRVAGGRSSPRIDASSRGDVSRSRRPLSQRFRRAGSTPHELSRNGPARSLS